MDAAPVVHIGNDDTSFRRATGRLLSAAGFQVALYETSQQFTKPVAKVQLLETIKRAIATVRDRSMACGAFELAVSRDSSVPTTFMTAHDDGTVHKDARRSGCEYARLSARIVQ
jgi:cysteine sulfinate desulfinase/cysteine desulfurase-like protein